uniref:Uncharacterized protein n=1 Tax=Sphaerodactylus townsendi TaxID=933632 RepID=A0ACB8FFB7_9SAUR
MRSPVLESRVNAEWIAWIPPAQDAACVSEANVTAPLAGEEPTVKLQELLVWTSVRATAPSYPKPACAVVIRVGLDMTVQLVIAPVAFPRLRNPAFLSEIRVFIRFVLFLSRSSGSVVECVLRIQRAKVPFWASLVDEELGQWVLRKDLALSEMLQSSVRLRSAMQVE